MSRIRHIRVLDYINSQQNIEFFQSFFSFFSCLEGPSYGNTRITTTGLKLPCPWNWLWSPHPGCRYPPFWSYVPSSKVSVSWRGQLGPKRPTEMDISLFSSLFEFLPSNKGFQSVCRAHRGWWAWEGRDGGGDGGLRRGRAPSARFGPWFLPEKLLITTILRIKCR